MDRSIYNYLWSGNFLSIEEAEMKFRKEELLLLFIPLAISILFMVFVPRDPYQSDGQEYDLLAKNLISGKGYSIDGANAYGLRPPLYSFFVSLFYLIFGVSPYPIILAQIVLLMVVPLIIKKMLLNADFNERESFWGALFVSIYPFGYVYAQQIITESLTTFLLSVAGFCAVKIWLSNDVSFKKIFVYGILITLPALSKSQHISMVCALLLVLFFRLTFGKGLRLLDGKKIGALLLSMLIVLAPWGIRNYYHFKKTAILGYGAFGEGLLKGYYHAKGDWLIWRYWNIKSPEKGPFFDEWNEKMNFAEEEAKRRNIDAGEIKTQLAIEEIKKDPIEAVRGYIVRAYSLWISLPKGGQVGFKAKAVIVFIEIIFLISSLLGILLFRKQLIKSLLPVYICVLAEAILLPIIDIESRYSISLKPFLMIAGGLVAEKIFNNIKSKFRNVRE